MACVGIDLGTTYSVVCIYAFPKVVPIYEDGADTPLVPSVVSFQDNQQFVGKEAVKRAGDNPKNTIYEIKRLMGRKYEEEDVQNNITNLTYDVVKHDGKLKVKIRHLDKDQYMVPEEISAIILRKLKEIAEKHLKTEVNHAVITVPAYFQEAQRQATIDAGRIAGLTVRRIINEPTAAALAYGLDVKLKKEKKILVYDLGGGTFDVSILKIAGNLITVLSTHGDTFLGGCNFVDEMVKHTMTGFAEKFNKDLKNDSKAMTRVREQCEMAKRQLSSNPTATFKMILLDDENDHTVTISRKEFEAMNEQFFQKTIKLVDAAMDIPTPKINIGDIDDILLVGGSTHIPIVKTLLMEKFNFKDIIVSVNRDEVVSRGAAIQASILHGTNVEDIKDLLLQDITPLTLGINVDEGLMSDVIPRCSRIPIKRRKNYTTKFDDQSSVKISVYEGERPIVKHNILLGEFTLTGIPAAPAGKPSIHVTFDIDENSILQVTAKEQAGGREETRIVSSKKGSLSKEEVEYMLKGAEVFRKADTEKKEKLTARSSVHRQATAMLAQLREGDLSDTLTPRDKKRLEDQMKEHLHWLEHNKDANVDEYKDREADIRRIELTIQSKPAATRRRIDNVD